MQVVGAYIEDGRLEHSTSPILLNYLELGDLVVVNQTRVMPARLVGKKQNGRRVRNTAQTPRDIDALGAVWEVSGKSW